VLRAIMGISVRAISLPDRPQRGHLPVFACAGKTDPTNLSDIVGNFRPGAAAFPGSFPQEPQLGPRGEARGRVFPGCTSPEARRARYRLPIGSPALPP